MWASLRELLSSRATKTLCSRSLYVGSISGARSGQVGEGVGASSFSDQGLVIQQDPSNLYQNCSSFY